jgi:hypothetical protein
MLQFFNYILKAENEDHPCNFGHSSPWLFPTKQSFLYQSQWSSFEHSPPRPCLDPSRKHHVVILGRTVPRC